MTMKTRILSLSFVWLSGMLVYAQDHSWTLRDALEHGLEHNLQIKQAYLSVLDAETGKRDAVGNFLPTFNLSAGHSWNIGLNQNITTGLFEDVTTQFTNASLNVGVDIYNGRQNVLRLMRSNLAVLANQYQLEDMKTDVVLLVVNSYLQALFSREVLRTEKAQLAISQEELRRTMEQVDTGVLPEGDLFEIRASLAAQEQQTIVAENNFRLAKISLAQLLLIEDYENFIISEEEFPLISETILNKSPQELVQKAMEHRDDIKLALTNVEIAQTDLGIAKAATKPRLSGYYSYSSRISYADRLVNSGVDELVPIGFVESTGATVVRPVPIQEVAGPLPLDEQFRLNDGHNFGLSLNIPILNGFTAKNSVDRSRINVSRSEYQYKQQVLDLENTVNQAYNDARGALQAFDAAQKTLDSRQKAYAYAQSRFEVGAATAFEFSRAKQQYEAAQSDWVRTKYDYIFKIKVLELYFGIPITEI